MKTNCNDNVNCSMSIMDNTNMITNATMTYGKFGKNKTSDSWRSSNSTKYVSMCDAEKIVARMLYSATKQIPTATNMKNASYKNVR